MVDIFFLDVGSWLQVIFSHMLTEFALQIATWPIKVIWKLFGHLFWEVWLHFLLPSGAAALISFSGSQRERESVECVRQKLKAEIYLKINKCQY